MQVILVVAAVVVVFAAGGVAVVGFLVVVVVLLGFLFPFLAMFFSSSYRLAFCHQSWIQCQYLLNTKDFA